jgi:hypothetical protein
MGGTRHAGDVPEWAERRRAEIVGEIARIGWPLPGSVSTGLRRRCGRANCRCRDPLDPRPHGPYASWFRQVAGKTVTKALSPAQAEAYAAWTEDNRRLTSLVDELRGLALLAAQAREGWPALPTPPRQAVTPPPDPD